MLFNWGPVETRWSTDYQAYGTGVWVESADWRRRVNPAIAATVPTGIVGSNYCRAEESYATDLRLHPVARGHWALDVAYITGVVCHGKLEDDACQPSDLYPPTRETARLRRSSVRGPVRTGGRTHLGPNEQFYKSWYTHSSSKKPQRFLYCKTTASTIKPRHN